MTRSCLATGLTGALGSLVLVSCTVVPPGKDTGSGASKEPGKPFIQNICFQCTLRACTISANACLREMQCAQWLDCVGTCPTDQTGVAADGDCLRKCGLPASAEVFFECVQDYSTGFFGGCEGACLPIAPSQRS
jgi:hypothetical protein